jgi:hypothetical protein
MLSHCVNSQCAKPFLRLREGRLFLVQTSHRVEEKGMLARVTAPLRKPPQHVEHFWLCDGCAPLWTLVQNGSQGISLVPLRQPAGGGKEATAANFLSAI